MSYAERIQEILSDGRWHCILDLIAETGLSARNRISELNAKNALKKLTKLPNKKTSSLGIKVDKNPTTAGPHAKPTPITPFAREICLSRCSFGVTSTAYAVIAALVRFIFWNKLCVWTINLCSMGM